MSPLHVAVIKNRPDEVAKLAKVSGMLQSRDPYGFQPVALAQLLDRRACLEAMGMSQPRQFQVRLRGESLQSMGVSELEKALNFHYLPHLNFGSYEQLERMIGLCPWLTRWTPLGNPSRQLANRYSRRLEKGYVAPVRIEWIDEQMGYGLFAARNLEKGRFLASYAGRVRGWDPLHPDHNPYCLHYPTRFWSRDFYMVDSLEQGNETRFINHSERGNLHLLTALDRGVQHAIFLTSQPIHEGGQLLFNYGPNFWRKRKSAGP